MSKPADKITELEQQLADLLCDEEAREKLAERVRKGKKRVREETKRLGFKPLDLDPNAKAASA